MQTSLKIKRLTIGAGQVDLKLQVTLHQGASILLNDIDPSCARQLPPLPLGGTRIDCPVPQISQI